VNNRVLGLTSILNREIELAKVEKRIQERVREGLDQHQKEYYLQEQLRAIHEELGDDDAEERTQFEKKLTASKMNKEARDRVERELKNRYCRQFREFLLNPFDKQMAGAMTTMSATTPDDVYGQYVVHVVRRINILKARLDDSDMEGLSAKPQPSYVTFMNTQDPGMTQETKKVFGSLYLSNLIWRSDSSDTTREMAELQSWLKQLVAAKGGNLQWLTSWVDVHSGLPAVTLKEFWGGSLTVAEEKSVRPSFTRKGKAAVDSLMVELQAALPDQETIPAQKAGFDGWYRTAAIESWQGFFSNFSKAIERLQGAKE